MARSFAMPIRSLRSVLVKHLGQTYSGSYEIVGDRIVVSSAYGSKSAVPGRTRANVVAAELMRKIAEDFRR